jgi:hypothetical protein
MNKREYIGKVVVSAKTKARFILVEVHAAYLTIATPERNAYGTRSHYRIDVLAQDPFSSKEMYFEDDAVHEKFIQEYPAYIHSESGRAEANLHWILTGD